MDKINVQAGTYIFIIIFCLRNTLQYIIHCSPVDFISYLKKNQ